PPAEAAARVLARSNPVEIAAMLDAWALVRQAAGRRGWRDLLAVARAADRDVFRTDLRFALDRDDREALKRLADAAGKGALATPSTPTWAWPTGATASSARRSPPRRPPSASAPASRGRTTTSA